MRSAMRLRIDVCGTRRHLTRRRRRRRLLAHRSALRLLLLSATCSSTSSTVMRPPAPLPRTSAACSSVLRKQPPHRRAVATARNRRRMRRTEPQSSRHRRLLGRAQSSWCGAAAVFAVALRFRARLNAAEQLARRNLVLLLLAGSPQHAAGRRRDLDRDLVGLELDQRLVLDDDVADGLQPALDLRARAFGLLARRADFDGGSCHAVQTLAMVRIACTMRATLGTTASSSSGLCGLGTSGIVTRSIGASRSKNASRASGRRNLGAETGGQVVLVHDQAAPRLAHRRQHRRAVPRHERAQVEHLGIDRASPRRPARSARPSRPRSRSSPRVPARSDPRLAERHDVVVARDKDGAPTHRRASRGARRRSSGRCRASPSAADRPRPRRSTASRRRQPIACTNCTSLRLAVPRIAALEEAARHAHDHRRREAIARCASASCRNRSTARSPDRRTCGTGSRAPASSPASAMPTARPMMPSSDRLVSNTRAAPNFSCSPSVAACTPPLRPTSSPNTTTRGFIASSCSSVRRIAVTMLMRGALGVRDVGVPSARLDAFADRPPCCCSVEACRRRVSSLNTWRVTCARIGRRHAARRAAARVCDILRRARVRALATRLRVHQRRHQLLTQLAAADRARARRRFRRRTCRPACPGRSARTGAARAGAAARAARRARTASTACAISRRRGARIGAVAFEDLQVAERLRDSRRCCRRASGTSDVHRDAVAVVLDEEQHRQPLRRRDVERRPETVGRDRRLAAVRDAMLPRDASRRAAPARGSAATAPSRPPACIACRRRRRPAARTGRSRRGRLKTTPMSRPSLTLPERIIVEASASSMRQPERQHQRSRPVVDADAVACAGQMLREQRLGDVVAARGELVEHLARRQEARLLELVERAREQHRVHDALPVDWAAATGRSSCDGDGGHGGARGLAASWPRHLAVQEGKTQPNRASEQVDIGDNLQIY